jgi:hypothetical protein
MSRIVANATTQILRHAEQAKTTPAKPDTGRKSAQIASGTVLSESGSTAIKATSLATDVATKIGENASKPGQKTKLIPKGSKLGKFASALGVGLSFVGHLLGDKRVAKTTTGHVVNSAAKTGGDALAAAATAKDALTATNALAGVAAAADGLVAVDNPIKAGTHLASELLPGAQASKAIGGGVDGLTAGFNYVTGDKAAAYRGAAVVQDNSVNGEYGSITQSATYGVAALMGDKETLNKATDHKAMTGERGWATAWGNAAADLAMGTDDSGVVKEAWDAHKNMKWYKPWTW